MKRVVACALWVLGASCSVGDGSGQVRGALRVPQCSIDDALFDLQPTFFGADFFDGSMLIRIAQGGETSEYSDEFSWRVNDTRYVAAHLNERIPVGLAGVAPVQATFRPAHSCGHREPSQYTPTVALEATNGYVVFTSVYRGDPNADATLRAITVREFSISMRDPHVTIDVSPTRPASGPAAREPLPLPSAAAEFEGWFNFYFARGRPAQRFQ